jgi:hypothetical protein
VRATGFVACVLAEARGVAGRMALAATATMS